MHNGGFDLVKKKRKTKANFSFINTDREIQLETSLSKKLNKVVEEFESSQFCFDLLQGIKCCTKSKETAIISEILCYGIGNFSENKASLHQLAALQVFHKKFNGTVKLYDPILTPTEIKVLTNLNFEVLPDNEEGKRKICPDQITLVFLPHCPKQLINNFLWANWSLNLVNCILISNSFSKIIESSINKVLLESAGYILKLQSKVSEITLENNYQFENIFNDTSIHYFSKINLDESFFLKSLEQEPVYSDSNELITRVSKLEV